jgi:hypothetical protein
LRGERILANAPTLVCCGLGWVFVVGWEMTDERDAGRGSWAGWGLGGLVVVYFGFPAVWMWPFWMVYRYDPPRWIEVLVSPIIWLAALFPLYGKWVEWGGKLLGIN